MGLEKALRALSQVEQFQITYNAAMDQYNTTHHIVGVFPINCAILWSRDIVVSWPSWSQRPSNIFPNLRWFPSEFRFLEKATDVAENCRRKQWPSTFDAIVSLIGEVQTHEERMWHQKDQLTTFVTALLADRVYFTLGKERSNAFWTVARNVFESAVQSTKGSLETYSAWVIVGMNTSFQRASSKNSAEPSGASSLGLDFNLWTVDLAGLVS